MKTVLEIGVIEDIISLLKQTNNKKYNKTIEWAQKVNFFIFIKFR
jgi:hypothetical protein